MRRSSPLAVLALVACLSALAAAGDKEPKAGKEPKAAKSKSELPAAWEHHAGKLPFVLGFEKGMASVRETGKPPMYFFTTTWCGWCKKLAGESFVDDEVVKVLEKFTPIIVDGDTEKATCSKYGVTGFPKIVFADLKGEAVVSVGGYKPKAEFLASAQDAAKKIKSGPTSKAMKALEEAKKELDQAQAKGKVKAALAAIAKIEKVGGENDIVTAATAAKEKLLADGKTRLDAATALKDGGDVEGARKAASALAAEYAGTEVGDAAKALVTSLPAPEKK